MSVSDHPRPPAPGPDAPPARQAARRALLEDTLALLQARRDLLGGAVADAAAAPLIEELAALGAGPSSVEPVRRLRQVSVLFCDIVGSTPLSERIDPEDVQTVVDGALAAFAELVRQHGGEVLRYTGDNLKAAFGAAGAREDDAERAVRCGLAVLEEAARRGEALRRERGLDGFRARAGIHTGPVVRGGGVEGDNSLTGLAVNVAARMEQAAKPGTLRISRDTQRQVQGLFDVDEEPPLAVKGLTAPMRTFVVRSLRERRLRGLRHGADGVTTAMVGRDEQRARLQALLTSTAPAARLRSASVIGDAGLGKSRLLAEFQAGLPLAQAHGLWRAASHPQALHQPYGLLRDLLFWRIGVPDSDSQAQAQQRFADALAPLFGADADEPVALLGQLIGLDFSASRHVAGILRDGQQLRARGVNAFVQTLRLQAASEPLVLVLDDLHWADTDSLDALDHLMAEAPDLPAVLICAARPELLERRAAWAAGWPGHDRLDMPPLAEASSRALAGALLSRLAEPVPALEALLMRHAAGNPYYMEALTQMLVDTGVIDTATEPWQVREARLEDLKVPATLVNVLQATLDALDASTRRSLQQASMVGALFWDEALARIEPRAPEALPSLARRELVLPQAESSFEGAREFRFRHHLLHQVTYGTVLKAERRAAHGQAARWLAERSRGRENEWASEIAEHYERAGEATEAVHYWLHAAENANRRQADAAALAHAERALALDDGSDLGRQVRLQRVRAGVFLRGGRSEDHGQVVALLESLADRLDDDVLRLVLATDITWRLFLDGKLEEAVEIGERRLARAEAGAPAEAGRVHNVLFMVLMRLGRNEEAHAHARRGMEQAHAAGDAMTEGAILTNLGITYTEAGEVTLAFEHHRQALEKYRAIGSRNGVANVYLNLGVVEETIGRLEAALEQLERAERECRAIGARRLQGWALANLGGVLAELGHGEQGFEHALQGLRLARSAGDTRAEAYAHRGALLSAHALGRSADAVVHGRAGRVSFDALGHHEAAWEAACLMTRHLLALGEREHALAEAEKVLAEVAERGGWGDTVDAPYNLSRTLAPLGDPRAAGLLTVAHEALVAHADRFAEHVDREAFLGSRQVLRSIRRDWAAAQSGQAVPPAGPADP